jgi:hypothetical protein
LRDSDNAAETEIIVGSIIGAAVQPVERKRTMPRSSHYTRRRG